MNGYIIETKMPFANLPRGRSVRWIGISLSARSMIEMLEGHSPSVIDRSPAVLIRARMMGLDDGEVRRLHE